MSHGRVFGYIAYTEQSENRGTMIVHGVCYSVYTPVGSYYTYGEASSSQSFMQRVPWVVLTSPVFPPMLHC